jgi:hypothetical protein
MTQLGLRGDGGLLAGFFGFAGFSSSVAARCLSGGSSASRDELEELKSVGFCVSRNLLSRS